jgi:hypothetical protein
MKINAADCVDLIRAIYQEEPFVSSFRGACGFIAGEPGIHVASGKDQDGFRVPPANSADGPGMTTIFR